MNEQEKIQNLKGELKRRGWQSQVITLVLEIASLKDIGGDSRLARKIKNSAAAFSNKVFNENMSEEKARVLLAEIIDDNIEESQLYYHAELVKFFEDLRQELILVNRDLLRAPSVGQESSLNEEQEEEEEEEEEEEAAVAVIKFSSKDDEDSPQEVESSPQELSVSRSHLRTDYANKISLETRYAASLPITRAPSYVAPIPTYNVNANSGAAPYQSNYLPPTRNETSKALGVTASISIVISTLLIFSYYILDFIDTANLLNSFDYSYSNEQYILDDSLWGAINALNVLSVISWVISGILFLSWLYSAKKLGDRLPGPPSSWSKAWIWFWWIPVANFFVLYQVVSDTERRIVSHVDKRDKKYYGTGITLLWWFSFNILIFGRGFYERMFYYLPEEMSFDEWVIAYNASLVLAIVIIVAAAIAAFSVISVITKTDRAKSELAN